MCIRGAPIEPRARGGVWALGRYEGAVRTLMQLDETDAHFQCTLVSARSSEIKFKMNSGN